MVNSLSGHVQRDRKTGLVYGKARKTSSATGYARNFSVNKKTRKNECRAIILLRRNHGYTINQLSQGLRRSPSYIGKVLRNAITRGNIRHQDFRCIPYLTKMSTCTKRVNRLFEYMRLWQLFIDGYLEKPP